MTVISSPLAGLRRPRILIKAARLGAKGYRRKPALNRLLKPAPAKDQTAVIASLKLMEENIEFTRKLADGTYNARRHVQVLTALIVEAKRL